MQSNFDQQTKTNQFAFWKSRNGIGSFYLFKMAALGIHEPMQQIIGLLIQKGILACNELEKKINFPFRDDLFKNHLNFGNFDSSRLF